MTGRSAGKSGTPNQEWKDAILGRFLLPFTPHDGMILEIGPGGGRWTAVLQRVARHLYVLDVASTPLEVCRERFRACLNIEYLLGDGRTISLDDRGPDGIWSYDVFVHVNAVDARSYFAEFGRLLRPGAHAVIHHPGNGGSAYRLAQHRSDLTETMVRAFASENGLEVILQSSELVNEGDMLTVLRKPSPSAKGQLLT